MKRIRRIEDLPKTTTVGDPALLEGHGRPFPVRAFSAEGELLAEGFEGEALTPLAAGTVAVVEYDVPGFGKHQTACHPPANVFDGCTLTVQPLVIQ